MTETEPKPEPEPPKRETNSLEISESLISQSMLKRKEWSKKYRISDRMVFDLFSEFSSMIMIAKVHSGKKSKMKEVLPASDKQKLSTLLKNSTKSNPYEFDEKDMQDFRIPVHIFKEYSSIMKGLNKDC